MPTDPPRKPPARAPREQAITLLARREYSRAELERRLLTAGHAPEAVQATLDTLIEEGSLSNARYAESATRSLIGRGKGPRAIRAKLAQAGIDAELGQSALPEDLDWTAQARALLERRFADDAPATAQEWARRARFLLARGYTETQVRAVMGAMPRRELGSTGSR